MGRGKIVLVLVLAMLFTAGTAAAAGLDVTILPESGPHVAPDGTIMVPVGADAFNSVGLAVSFGGFAAGNPYTINIVNKNSVPVFTLGGTLPTGNSIIPLHWVVPNDKAQAYTAIATGVNGQTLRMKLATSMAPIAPVPELSTVALMSAGMIGLFGLVRIQRKD
jgi:hypothetical protein